MGIGNRDEHTINHFLEVDSGSGAFPEVASLTDTSRSLSTRFGDWRLSVSHEPDRQVLDAESGEKCVTQSITPNPVHKRFVFNVKKQRFEPMRQRIWIEETEQRKLQQIE